MFENSYHIKTPEECAFAGSILKIRKICNDHNVLILLKLQITQNFQGSITIFTRFIDLDFFNHTIVIMFITLVRSFTCAHFQQVVFTFNSYA